MKIHIKNKYHTEKINIDGESIFFIVTAILCSIIIVIMLSRNLLFNPYETVASSRSEAVSQVTTSVNTTYVEDVEPESNTIYLGEYRLTVYTQHSDHGKWGFKTATGVRSEHLTTCAVDPDIIPYGTVITVGGEDGLQLVACDCGNFSGEIIDIFYEGTEKEAHAWLMETFGDYADVHMVR